jgi:hypothetical protein
MADEAADSTRLPLGDSHDLAQLEHKQDLFVWLRQKWADLFQADFEVLLYDLTSADAALFVLVLTGAVRPTLHDARTGEQHAVASVGRCWSGERLRH